ncbi:hypothetical protein [Cereibacter changlensis]|uniref:hypothetical protein n=1 Tax=Cereibacter changlensis TaxID=402884 RepID=UPI004034A101
MTISAERLLWQTVVLTAFLDATVEVKETSTKETKNNLRDADRWIRAGGRSYREVCELAGINGEFMRARYIAGQVDPDLLRASKTGARNR